MRNYENLFTVFSMDKKIVVQILCTYTRDDMLNKYLNDLLRSLDQYDLDGAMKTVKSEFIVLLKKLDLAGYIFSDESMTVINFNIDELGSAAKPSSKNLAYYRDTLIAFGILNEHDQRYLSNRLARHYKKYDHVDNVRACISDADGTSSIDFAVAASNGCCGSYSEVLFNKVTNNWLKIGFNYGH